MKRLIALAVVAIASQAAVAFAGEPVVSSKQVIAPPPPPPEYFRPNEFLCHGSWFKWGQAARLGGRHRFHLLVPLEICGCQVPRGGSEYPRRWRFANSHPC